MDPTQVACFLHNNTVILIYNKFTKPYIMFLIFSHSLCWGMPLGHLWFVLSICSCPLYFYTVSPYAIISHNLTKIKYLNFQKHKDQNWLGSIRWNKNQPKLDLRQLSLTLMLFNIWVTIVRMDKSTNHCHLASLL